MTSHRIPDNFERAQSIVSKWPGRKRNYVLVKPKFERSVSSYAAPEGWKLVPVEPTEEMIVAFVEQWYCHKQTIDDPQMGDAYQAMLEAAPKFGEEE